MSWDSSLAKPSLQQRNSYVADEIHIEYSAGSFLFGKTGEEVLGRLRAQGLRKWTKAGGLYRTATLRN
jgi:hypothetical protein